MELIILLSALLGLAVADQPDLKARQNFYPNETSTNPFSLPNTANVQARTATLNTIRQNFVYGPDIVPGGQVYYPTGSYAQEMIGYDQSTLFGEHVPWSTQCQAEAQAAAQAVAISGGLTKLDDYKKFYSLGFKTALPDGPWSGMLENGTSDLLFSMERLSTAPFGTRRVNPSEGLSFTVDDATAKNITTLTHKQLLAQGRLFYLDHRNQGNIALIDGRYAAASEAYFYIHPTSGNFLPLAIKLNRGSNLVYTPADTVNDWTFAKMAFNMNDLWFQQWTHLQTTHVVTDIVFEAAVRSLNPDHPVYGMLDRLALQTFGFRLIAITLLLNKGGAVDKYFFSSGAGAAGYNAALYTSGAGDWIRNEFFTDMTNRGLINSTVGPSLQRYPYLEDGGVIDLAIAAVMTTYIGSYYSSDAAVKADTELQAFVREAISYAKVINFPSTITTRAALISFLTHFAMTVSVVHAVSNGNDPVHSTATLPYHPMAFYAPLPMAKGMKDLMPFMPNLTQAAGQITLLAAFNRPFINANNAQGSNRTLAEMFDYPPFLARANDATRTANTVFKKAMSLFSQVVQARKFDSNGLSQGMPFIWKVLDPLATPFYLTI